MREDNLGYDILTPQVQKDKLSCFPIMQEESKHLVKTVFFLLQVVMSPHSAPQAFVDNYIKLLPEADGSEFQKVLDMKVSEGHGMVCYRQPSCFFLQNHNVFSLLFGADVNPLNQT